jgi:hypothetical protein
VGQSKTVLYCGLQLTRTKNVFRRGLLGSSDYASSSTTTSSYSSSSYSSSYEDPDPCAGGRRRLAGGGCDLFDFAFASSSDYVVYSFVLVVVFTISAEIVLERLEEVQNYACLLFLLTGHIDRSFITFCSH